ncbi:MAG: tRNA (adenosine(37)-N6)-threonylcarbamoyltransferase complex ATPase subunit type 1 TsaE [Clostridiales bacterium]|nr:tRNA (adenosine(37)-N6)-threonylcarbamoyltransferase complex ATPase subunit type 1 TsaE [Clostridiales bacterium]
MIAIVSENEHKTERIGRCFAKTAPSRCLVFLKGTLGAGKTAFARGVAQGLGVERNVSSPTFTLVNEYQGQRGDLVHMDLYRLLDQPAEELGLEEYFQRPGICLVEWPDVLEGWECPDVTISIEQTGLEQRTFFILAKEELEQQLQEAFACEF